MRAFGHERSSTIRGKCFSERLVSDHEAALRDTQWQLRWWLDWLHYFVLVIRSQTAMTAAATCAPQQVPLGCASPRNSVYRLRQPLGEVAQALRLAFIDGSVI